LKIEFRIKREAKRENLENSWPGQGRSKGICKGASREDLTEQLLAEEIRADKKTKNKPANKN
jgi:hypothetical protein